VPPAPPSFNQIGCFGGVATDLGRPLPPSRTPVVPVLAVVPGTYPSPLASLERALCEGMWTHVRRLTVIFFMPTFELDMFGGTGGGDGREAREEYEGGARGEGMETGDRGISRSAASALSAFSRTPPPRPLPSDWPIWTPPSRPPASRPPRSLSVGGVRRWGVSDCRVVLSELATDLYTPLCSWLCFCTLFSAMVFTLCSCTFSVYCCLPNFGRSGRSQERLDQLRPLESHKLTVKNVPQVPILPNWQVFGLSFASCFLPSCSL